MLELKSSEWSKIRASAGGNGLLTAELLQQLYDSDESAWSEFYQQVCHQYTVGETAYVAVPHLVEIARIKEDQNFRALMLSTVGTIVASMYVYRAPNMRDEWKMEFVNACEEACRLAALMLQQRGLDKSTSFILISTLAALHGHTNLAMLMQDGENFWCPECGEYIDYGIVEQQIL
ncbi:MAG TPA: hypothetical protein VNB22_17200 [Pyrinomonadaceae bacterium]|nr:hypothetical protein [Pyrinomonadaceae bacterium]